MIKEVNNLLEKKLACYHCGDDCADDAISIEDKAFCCSGCKTVYEILTENALDEYYLMEANNGHSWKWIRLQQSELSIMAITNLNASISGKVNAIARLLVPPTTESPVVEEPKSIPIELTEKEMQAYTGFFWDSKYLFTTEISIKDGGLYYTDLHNGWNFALTPLSKTLFESPPWNKVEITNLEGQKKLKLMLRDGRKFPCIFCFYLAN